MGGADLGEGASTAAHCTRVHGEGGRKRDGGRKKDQGEPRGPIHVLGAGDPKTLRRQFWADFKSPPVSAAHGRSQVIWPLCRPVGPCVSGVARRTRPSPRRAAPGAVQTLARGCGFVPVPFPPRARSQVLSQFFRDVGSLCNRTAKALSSNDRSLRRPGRPSLKKRKRKDGGPRCVLAPFPRPPAPARCPSALTECVRVSPPPPPHRPPLSACEPPPSPRLPWRAAFVTARVCPPVPLSPRVRRHVVLPGQPRPGEV